MSRLDFTDRGIIGIYEELASGNIRAMERLIDSLEQRCRVHAYISMVSFTNALIDFYEDGLRNHVMSVFQRWRDGDASLSALALQTGCGQEAANTGRRLMDELETGLAGMFRRSFSRVSVDTSAPVLDQNDISSMQEDINALLRQSESVCEEAVSSCSARGDQNTAYFLIQPVIKNTGASMQESFGSTIRQILDGSDQFLRGIEITVSSNTLPLSGPGQAAAIWPDPSTFI